MLLKDAITDWMKRSTDNKNGSNKSPLKLKEIDKINQEGKKKKGKTAKWKKKRQEEKLNSNRENLSCEKIKTAGKVFCPDLK
jgi:hypothetical protein